MEQHHDLARGFSGTDLPVQPGLQAHRTDRHHRADYPEGEANQFTGKINWVRIDLEEDDVSRLKPPEHKYHRTLARQQSGAAVMSEPGLAVLQRDAVARPPVWPEG